MTTSSTTKPSSLYTFAAAHGITTPNDVPLPIVVTGNAASPLALATGSQRHHGIALVESPTEIRVYWSRAEWNIRDVVVNLGVNVGDRLYADGNGGLSTTPSDDLIYVVNGDDELVYVGDSSGVLINKVTTATPHGLTLPASGVIPTNYDPAGPSFSTPTSDDTSYNALIVGLPATDEVEFVLAGSDAKVKVNGFQPGQFLYVNRLGQVVDYIEGIYTVRIGQVLADGATLDLSSFDRTTSDNLSTNLLPAGGKRQMLHLHGQSDPSMNGWYIHTGNDWVQISQDLVDADVEDFDADYTITTAAGSATFDGTGSTVCAPHTITNYEWCFLVDNLGTVVTISGAPGSAPAAWTISDPRGIADPSDFTGTIENFTVNLTTAGFTTIVGSCLTITDDRGLTNTDSNFAVPTAVNAAGNSQLIQQTLSPVLVDNIDTTEAGPWTDFTDPSTYLENGARVITGGTAAAGDTVTYPGPTVAGYYEVRVWDVAQVGSETSAQYAITHADGQTFRQLDQSAAASPGWTSLGYYEFTGAAGEGVVLSSGGTSDGDLYADAIEFVPPSDVLRFDSFGSTPSLGEALSYLEYTITVVDQVGATSLPNDGRVIVVGGQPTLGVAVISDTGGTPATRLTSAQLEGRGRDWWFVPDIDNDFFLMGVNSSIVTSLTVTDTSAATDTEASI